MRTLGSHVRLLAKVGLACGMAAVLPGCSRAKLDLDPAVLSSCAPKRGHVIRVTWDASRTTSGHVVLKIARPGAEPRPWRTEPPTGSALTGPWGDDGFTVTVVGAHGRILARRTLVTSPCPPDSGR